MLISHQLVFPDDSFSGIVLKAEFQIKLEDSRLGEGQHGNFWCKPLLQGSVSMCSSVGHDGDTSFLGLALLS